MKMQRLIALAAFTSVLMAQSPNLDRMKKDLYYLTGPECMGRGTGEEGQKVAAAYIAKQFQAMGLDTVQGPTMSGYLFSYPLKSTVPDAAKTTLVAGNITLKAGIDFETMSATPSDAPLVKITPEQINETLDIKGKAVFVLMDANANMQQISRQLQPLGPAGIIMGWTTMSPETKTIMTMLQAQGSAPRLSIPGVANNRRVARSFTIWLTGQGVSKLNEAFATNPSPSLSFTPAVTETTISASNVVGVLTGSDPVLKNEYVILSAHHDHLGGTKESYYPGADDDASGTTGLMEIARMLKSSRPKRSILFLSVSGEEKGLLGSESFLLNSPIAIASIKADINIDMIGRNGTDEITVAPARVEGAMYDLTKNARLLANKMKLELTAEADQYWMRSDHYNFFKRGIPAVFFFSGMHEDYHQKSDTPDKINFEKMGKIASLTRDLILETANAPTAPNPISKEDWSAWVWPAEKVRKSPSR